MSSVCTCHDNAQGVRISNNLDFVRIIMAAAAYFTDDNVADTLVLWGKTPRQAALQEPELWRNLDVVEVFSGVASIVKGAVNKGFRAEPFDLVATPEHDITDEHGFQRALQLVLRVRPGGLVTMAPQCSSFVSACANNHQRKRSNHFYGDETKQFVREGNAMATAAAFLLVVAWLRELFVLPENTPGSVIWNFSPFQAAVALTCAFERVVPRCFYQSGAGEKLYKRYKFASNSEVIIQILAKAKCTCKSHINLSKKFVQSDTGRAKKNIGKVRWSGQPKLLKESQAYPLGLGAAIVSAWLDAKAALGNPPAPINPVGGVQKKPAARSKKPAARAARKRPAAADPVVSEPEELDWLQLDAGTEQSAGNGDADDDWMLCNL